MSVYIDTSALAKWYVNEARSEEVEEYLKETCPAYICLLTKLEMISLMNRRVHEGHFGAATQADVLTTFEGDIIAGHLVLLPQSVEAFLWAESMLGFHAKTPLATLDALHLGVMRAAGLNILATADKVMARAATALGMECREFA